MPWVPARGSGPGVRPGGPARWSFLNIILPTGWAAFWDKSLPFAFLIQQTLEQCGLELWEPQYSVKHFKMNPQKTCVQTNLDEVHINIHWVPFLTSRVLKIILFIILKALLKKYQGQRPYWCHRSFVKFRLLYDQFSQFLVRICMSDTSNLRNLRKLKKFCKQPYFIIKVLTNSNLTMDGVLKWYWTLLSRILCQKKKPKFRQLPLCYHGL